MLQHSLKPLSNTVRHPLPAEMQEQLDGITARIHARHRQQIESIIETGKDLQTVKDMLPHGAFLDWLDAEFGWSQKTANNYMSAARQFADKICTIENLSPTAVYALAARSTPDWTRAQIIQRLEAGDEVDSSAVKRMVAKARRTGGQSNLMPEEMERRELRIARLIVDMVGDRGPELLELLSEEEPGALAEVKLYLKTGKYSHEM